MKNVCSTLLTITFITCATVPLYAMQEVLQLTHDECTEVLSTTEEYNPFEEFEQFLMEKARRSDQMQIALGQSVQKNLKNPYGLIKDLRLLCKTERPETIVCVLKKCLNELGVTLEQIKNDEGKTILHLAAGWQNQAVVEILLAAAGRGAYKLACIKDNRDMTALYLAVFSCYSDIVELLLATASSGEEKAHMVKTVFDRARQGDRPSNWDSGEIACTWVIKNMVKYVSLDFARKIGCGWVQDYMVTRVSFELIGDEQII